MAKHKFPCRSCGVSLTVAETAIGGTVTCPSCGEHTIVPTPEEEAARKEELRLKDEQAKARAAQERKDEQRRKEEGKEQSRREASAQRVKTIMDEEEARPKKIQASTREAEARRQTVIAERRKEDALALGRPVAPMMSISFLNVMTGLLVLAGILSIIGGVFASIEAESAAPMVVTGAAAISSFWMAALTYAAISVVCNVYGIHEKLDKMQAARDQDTGRE